MRRHLGSSALTAALATAVAGSLAACGPSGDDRSGSVVTGAPSPGKGTSDPPDADGAGSGEVELVRGTEVGGTVADEAVAVTGEQGLGAFLEQFDPAFADRLRTRVDRLVAGGGTDVLAQVVAVGCESPTSATLRGDRVEVVLPKPEVQCRAPVTTVALAVP